MQRTQSRQPIDYLTSLDYRVSMRTCFDCRGNICTWIDAILGSGSAHRSDDVHHNAHLSLGGQFTAAALRPGRDHDALRQLTLPPREPASAFGATGSQVL